MLPSKSSSDAAPLIAEYENAGDSSRAIRCWFRLDVLRLLCVELADDMGDEARWRRWSMAVCRDEVMDAFDGDAARSEVAFDGDAAM